jgi:hypothetical protein
MTDNNITHPRNIEPPEHFTQEQRERFEELKKEVCDAIEEDKHGNSLINNFNHDTKVLPYAPDEIKCANIRADEESRASRAKQVYSSVCNIVSTEDIKQMASGMDFFAYLSKQYKDDIAKMHEKGESHERL